MKHRFGCHGGIGYLKSGSSVGSSVKAMEAKMDEKIGVSSVSAVVAKRGGECVFIGKWVRVEGDTKLIGEAPLTPVRRKLTPGGCRGLF